MKVLTKKQRDFIREYLKDLNAENAAIRAGYAKNKAGFYARELLKNTKILEQIKKTLENQPKSLQVGRSFLLFRLLETVKFCLAQEDVIDKEGNPTGCKKLRDGSNGLKALDLLFKKIEESSEESITPEGKGFIGNIDITGI